MDIKRGIDKAVAKVVESIKDQAETVGDNYDKIEQVATVSANNDPVIGKLIADAMRKVSKDGVITIERSKRYRYYYRCSRRYAVRPRLSVSLLRDKYRENGL